MVGQFYLEQYFSRGSSRKLTTRQLEALANAQTWMRRGDDDRTGTSHADGARPSTCARTSARSRSSRASRWRSAGVRCWCWSARPARASRRSCAASTTWSRSTPAGCMSTAMLIGYREQGASCYEMPPREAAKQRRDIGMVFQHFNLFPHRTALANIIEAPIQVKGVKKAEARGAGPRSAGSGRAGGEGGRLPGAAVRRAAAAGRDRPGAGDGPQADAVRRADLGAGPGAGRRGARA